MTRDEMVAKIKEMAVKTGRPPSLMEFMEAAKVTRRTVRKMFGSYITAVQECGLEPRRHALWIPLSKLFTEWAGAARELKKIPSLSEFERLSSHTSGPYMRRFKRWVHVPEMMAQYIQQNGLEEAWPDVMALIEQERDDKKTDPFAVRPGNGLRPPTIRDDRPVFGPLLTGTALAHEPVNEMGVVFLFGALAERLGYKVTLLQTEFPDCEALLEIGPKRWQRIRIEFEYESRNFLRHAHKAEDCDMIICWAHNWPECPLEVVELRDILEKLLPQRTQRNAEEILSTGFH